jgi:hypothetical protein
MRGKIAIITGLAFVLAALVMQYHEAWSVRDLDYARARYGAVEHVESAPAVFVAEEVVLPGWGVPEYLIAEGERVRKGEYVARVGTEEVVTPQAGLFFSMTDGEENVYTKENLQEADWDYLLENFNGQVPLPNAGVAGKIVNNLKPSWALLQTDSTEGVLPGDTLRFSLEGKNYTGVVMRISDEQKAVVIRCNQYIEGTTTNRRQDVLWQRQTAKEGIIVPLSSLYNRGEERGVFAVTEGIILFQQVKVLDQNNEFACLENVAEGTYVVLNPREGLQGLHVRPHS